MPTLQSSLFPVYGHGRVSGSMVVRAVVINTYFADQENRPGVVAPYRNDHPIKAVSCDVLTYGSKFRFFLPRIPVAQMRHGLNDHDVWMPRPTTLDLRTGQAPILPQGIPAGSRDNTSRVTDIANQERVGDPRDFDGDHVLVEFIENDPQQAFIRADQLPHPRATFRMEAADGERVRSQFRGVIQEIDSQGNLMIDARAGNDGSTDADGNETPANATTSGNVSIEANAAAEINVVGRDADDSNEQFRMRLKANELLLDLVANLSLLIQGNQANTTLQVGDGAVAVAIAEALQSYIDNSVKTTFDSHTHSLASHTHAVPSAGLISATPGDPVTGSAVSGPPTPTDTLAPNQQLPSYDTAITSTKVTIPDG